MSDLIASFTNLPTHGISAVILLLLYAVQSEVRFGRRARSVRTEASDHYSTLIVSLSATVPVFGLSLAIKSTSSLPAWFKAAVIPGLPSIAWAGVAFGFLGLATRLWAVLTLRERYTKTLLVHASHAVERGGPYRWVRHPGYLGSLLILNGVALASGNWVVFVSSLIATLLAYTYRIRVEDKMLVGALGQPYADYRQQVRALFPIPRL
ncbi:methyltransferase family protein [Geothrix terrae]|uniref:methyltransferase family protein n=1 Tax=Geothrix terrae TaxID=2922720 RepID=UPI001FAE3B3D|nr:isoprenylcysteine carboxylmethyltransferase family protein [Geothrix terrae]